MHDLEVACATRSEKLINGGAQADHRARARFC